MMDMISRTLNRVGQLRGRLLNHGYGTAMEIRAKPVGYTAPTRGTAFETRVGLPLQSRERSMNLFWMAGFFASLISPLHAQERKDLTITQLVSSTVTACGQRIVLPQRDPEVVASIYEIAAGATLPVHKHPYPMFAYVLSGHLRVTNTETGRSYMYNSGDFILECVEQWHMGTNLSREPLKLLVINIVERGRSNTVLQGQSIPSP